MNSRFLTIGYASLKIPEPEGSTPKKGSAGLHVSKDGFDKLMSVAEKKLSGRRNEVAKSNSENLKSATAHATRPRGATKSDGLLDEKEAPGPETKNEDVEFSTTVLTKQTLDQAAAQQSAGPYGPAISATLSAEMADQAASPSAVKDALDPQNSEKQTGSGQIPHFIDDVSGAIPQDNSKFDADLHGGFQTKGSAGTKTQVNLLTKLNEHSEISDARQENGLQIKIQVVKTESQFNFASPVAGAVGVQIVKNLSAKPSDTVGIFLTPKYELRSALTKTLHIQLHPESLGALTVSMSLRGKELELKIETSLQETAVKLSRDRELLKDFVESAGYEIGEKSVMISFNPDQNNFDTKHNGGQFGNESNAAQSQSSTMNFAERRDPGPDVRREKKYETHTSFDSRSVDQKFDKTATGPVGKGVFI